ncbi:MAG: hypothetical protein AAFO94_20635, partial [Bacteroidota bacterium]
MNRVQQLLTAAFLLFTLSGNAQQIQSKDQQVNLLFGLSQLTLDGFNVEVNYAYKRFIFDYSHGISLNLDNELLEAGADKDQGLDLHIPWTTGFGVGYRFTNWLNLRVEPKWHRFELYYDGDAQTTTNLIGDYTTFTLGLGLYANLRPFKKQQNFLKGIMIAPNVRWWPRVSSSLNDDAFSY